MDQISWNSVDNRSTATEPSALEQTATVTAPENVEVDTSYESDAAYDDAQSWYSASLTSSALDFRHENGRRYHSYHDGTYLLPNDETENDRMDMLHELCLIVLHRNLYLAPIKNPRRALDLATGTGIWAIDFADQHPEAEVIGCDLSPIQPTSVPPNLKFLVDDIESNDWEYGRDQFDYIHARSLAVAIRDFARLIKRCYRSVKPGGWVEFQDWDGYPTSEDGSHKGTGLDRYYNEVYSTFEEIGYDVRPGPKLEKWFKDAGFVNVHVERFVIPYGVWPKDPHLKKIGAWNKAQAEETGYEALALAALTRYKQWKKEEVIILASQARADGRRRDIHCYFNFYVVYGQRPVNGHAEIWNGQ
ncbi:hypothetical protein VTN49DRAFT_1444 [Thermomyces lanuginosus]|uniref:uncharacterized protein n=1 Tax=Thermomyces lanuginosus TaxID=5541 RepID=UPI00374346BF